MKRSLIIIIASILSCAAASAQITDKKHEVRIGIGENTMQRVAFRDTPHSTYSNLPSGSFKESQGHSYIPHFFVEYNYNIKKWLSVGAQLDLSGFSWTDCYYNAGSDIIARSEAQNCINACILPQVRFNWLRKQYFTMYSAIRAGIDINGGTETDVYGHKTVCVPAVAPAFIGINAGKGRYFGAVEISPILAFKNQHMVYLPMSRIISISGGIRF